MALRLMRLELIKYIFNFPGISVLCAVMTS